MASIGRCALIGIGALTVNGIFFLALAGIFFLAVAGIVVEIGSVTISTGRYSGEARQFRRSGRG